MGRLRRVSLLLAVLSAASAAPAAAQPYPNKPIRIIVPFPPGGGTDLTARMLVEPLREQLGQPLVIENKPGAGGAVGAAEAARAPADGYTLLLTASTLAIAPAVLANPGYDAVRDFAGIGQVATVPLLVLTRPDSPLETFADFVALARKEGDKVTYASVGNATSSHLIGLAIQQKGGLAMTHVPYKGAMQALPDMAAGAVTIGLMDPISMMPFVRQGRLKALAVTGPKRLPALPDKPTLIESGVNFEAVGWNAMFAPAAVPPAVLGRLNEALTRALARPEIRERIVSGGSVPVEPAYTAPEWTAQYQREIAQWAEIVRAGGVKP